MTAPVVTRGEETAARSRTARRAGDLDRAPPQLTTVPRPRDGESVVALRAVAGGLDAVQAEWGPDGGAVVLTGAAPFAGLTGRAGFRADGSFDGTVRMRARVGLLGLELGEATWRVDGWTPDRPLPAPAVTLRGSTLAVDLRTLPAEAAWTAREGVDARSTDQGAVVHLPSSAVPAGTPLSPRLAEVYRGLLGADLPDLRVHPDSPVGDVPAFVADHHLFLAPGIYGADAPEPLRLLDAAIRAALIGLVGAVTGEPAPVVEPAPPGPAAPAAPTDVVPARVPDEPSAGHLGPGGTATTPAGSTSEPPVDAATEATDDAVAASQHVSEAVPPPVELLMPEPPTELTPAAAARGGAVRAGARGAARAARDLPSADETVADSRGAVAEPVAETAARARGELAAALGERPAPSPEIVELAGRIRTAIRENRPEDEDELLETDPTQQARAAGATVTGSVQAQSDQVGAAYDAMASPPAGAPALVPDALAQPSPASPGMGTSAADAAPDPIPPEHTTLDADVAATDQRVAASGIDTRVTREIPDGPFAEARDARAGLGEVAERAPQQIQAEQQQAIESAQADMAELQLQAVSALRAARAGTVGSVGAGQAGMVGSEEQTRESVSRRAQQIYDDAQRQVQHLLDPLSRTALARWEAGLTRLSQEFHDSLDRVKRWIDERHSGVGGALLAVGDYIGGLPDWVTDEYNRAERRFGDGVAELLLDISSDVNGVVAAAQALVQRARDDIDAAFTAMEAEFPEWAAQERARFAGLLDGLSQRVTQAQTSFVDDVSRRAVTAVNEVHAEAQALREEAGGLIGRVVAAIEEFLDDPVRAIINGLLQLVGIPPAAFWALIARIEQVIVDIADDPETFVNNLVAGVRLGFEQFFDTFGTHVLRGFWDWLFSGLETPIPMPRDLSPGSLFSFALQLMGITWPRVREIIVRHVGPTAVEVVESAWQLVSVLVERGPEGLVEMIRQQLTPESLVTMILDAAVEYLVETLIQQVVVRVVGMLNPVGAVAQAIDLIYQVCSWIFRNAARIFRFVDAVVNGMADVIAGNIGGLANAVEQALASLVPPVIDFLAGLLHLGGLPAEVAEVITRLQTLVYAALDRVVGFLVERGRALLARLGIGADEEGEGENEDEELGTTVRFSAGGESHRLWFEVSGEDSTLMVASAPRTIADTIAEWRGRLEELPSDDGTREAVSTKLDRLATVADQTSQDGDRLAREFLAAAREPDDAIEPPDDNTLEARERAIAGMLDELFTIFDPEGLARQRKQQIASVLPVRGEAQAGLVLERWKGEYLDLLRAKPVAGGDNAVFDPAAYTAGALKPIDVLTAEANHGSLLGYFEKGIERRGVDTDVFQAYALDDVGEPHTVRVQFLRGLGRRTLDQMRAQWEARLEPAGDSALLTQLRTAGYNPAIGKYGAFQPWPDRPLSVLVQGVVRAGLLAAFAAFVRGDPVGAVRFEEFRDELLRDQRTQTWLSSQVRGLTVGTHEWLPVSLALEVLDHAVVTGRQGREDLRRAMGWISLIHTLRTPTNGVLWSIVREPVLVPGGRAEEGAQVAPRGHVAALSLDRYTLVQDGLTVGTGEFHDALRIFFRDNRHMHPADWVDALLAHLPSIMWTGANVVIPVELRNRPIGVFYSMPTGFTPDITVAQLTAEQQRRWEEIVRVFRSAKAALP